MPGGTQGIVILGGGFGGLAAARVFGKHEKQLKRAGYAPALVDRVRHHLYTPLLYEVASGCATDRGVTAGMELSEGVSLHFSTLLKQCCGVGSLEDEVAAVDVKKKIVKLQGGAVLPYAFCILALGAETDYYNIPGLRQYSYALKRRSHALLIRQRIQEFIDKKRRREEARIEIVVGGGGATGVEFSAEMATCFRLLVARRVIREQDWTLTLVEASPRLLGMLAPQESEYAARRLMRLGVKVCCQTVVKRADHGGAVLASGDGVERTVEADVFVWTGGIRAPEITAALGVPLDPKGRVIVDPTMRVQGADGLFAIGDVASLPDPATKRPVPQIAQAALRQAEVAARNIMATIQNKKLRNYHFVNYPTIIPLGGKQAIAALGKGLVIRGFLGWFIRRLADLTYFRACLPFGSTMRVFFLGARAYTQND